LTVWAKANLVFSASDEAAGIRAEGVAWGKGGSAAAGNPRDVVDATVGGRGSVRGGVGGIARAGVSPGRTAVGDNPTKVPNFLIGAVLAGEGGVLLDTDIVTSIVPPRGTSQLGVRKQKR
jgi:hypothetical protein